jgi:hypothetical protein
MNKTMTPIENDVWKYLLAGHWNFTGKLEQITNREVMWINDGCFHSVDLGGLDRLIERDGLRGERLWEQFTYGECPDYRKAELEQAAHNGGLEHFHPDEKTWLNTARPTADAIKLVGYLCYRIKEQAGEEGPVCKTCHDQGAVGTHATNTDPCPDCTPDHQATFRATCERNCYKLTDGDELFAVKLMTDEEMVQANESANISTGGVQGWELVYSYEQFERFASAVHEAYCESYQEREGKPYWTGGDYTRLDERAKEIDRRTVLAVLSSQWLADHPEDPYAYWNPGDRKPAVMPKGCEHQEYDGDWRVKHTAEVMFWESCRYRWPIAENDNSVLFPPEEEPQCDHPNTQLFKDGVLTCLDCNKAVAKEEPQAERVKKFSKAPWTTEQVEILERRQENDTTHPYTCVCGHSLLPSKKGWYCEECPHTQNWCFASEFEEPKYAYWNPGDRKPAVMPVGCARQEQAELFPEEEPQAEREECTFDILREINNRRAIEWVGEVPDLDQLLFCATELGGEVGEAQNEVKKLFRELQGWKGGKPLGEATLSIALELADVIICADRLAACLDIDLWHVIKTKFNKTSDKHGLKTKFQLQRRVEQLESKREETDLCPFDQQEHNWTPVDRVVGDAKEKRCVKCQEYREI